MRKIIASGAALALATGLASAAPAGAGPDTTPPKGGPSSSRIVDGVTVNGIMQHLRAFQTIANRNGGNRASGLPGYDASVDYVAKRLKKAGYKVTKQEFTFPFSRDLEPATLSQLTPDQIDYETTSFSYSGSGDVTGPVVPIDVQIPPPAQPGVTSGCEASDFPEPPSDSAVALVQRGSCDFFVKASNASDAGYAAVVIFNEGQEGRTDVIAGTLGQPVDLPVVALSYEDGAALAQTEGAEVNVFTSTEADLERTTYNVLAELPKKKVAVVKPDETVVVGAHLDSVAEGAGINDNGSGSAAVLEIAEELAEIGPRRLQRPVRFAFWGAEEAGLLGSEHYVDSLSPKQLSKIYANLNFDMVGSPNYVRFVYDGDGSDTGPAGPPGSAEIERIFTDWFDSKGLASSPTEFSGRSDYGPFIAVGIPAGGLFTGAEGVKTEAEAAIYGGTAGEAYDACYHSVCDDIGNVNTQALFEMGDAAAHATWTALTSKRGVFPDGSAPPRAGKKNAQLEHHHPAR